MKDVFISHAGEDKAVAARPLAAALAAAGITVWLDEQELTLGDSLRQKIDSGLREARYGVVILSPAFFSSGKYWPAAELDGLVQREVNGAKVILPVWLNVDRDTVAKHSPMLGGRVAALWSRGLDHVAGEIARAVRGAASLPAHPTPEAGRRRKVAYRVPLSSLSSSSSEKSSKFFDAVSREYVIRAMAPLRRPSTDLKLPVRDVDFDVRVRKRSGSDRSWYGLCLLERPASGIGDIVCHDFFVSGLGTFTYETKRLDGDSNEQRDLKVVEPSRLGRGLKPGDSVNTLRIIRRGANVAFLANGKSLVSVSTALAADQPVFPGVAVHAERALPSQQHIEVGFGQWRFFESDFV